MALRLRAVTAWVLSSVLLVPPFLGGPSATAQTAAECMNPAEPTPEDFGPTDISAVTGNRRLSVGLNADATVTVLKWPSPSYYDQIKYRTVDRSEPLMGALPNEGAFIGIARRPGGPEWEFSWLRAWSSSQRFADDDTDEVVTTFKEPNDGLSVTVRDVVAHNRDALVRRVTVTRTPGSPIRDVRVLAFANFNPVFSKSPQQPYQDWCAEGRNDDGGSYDADADAVVSERSGFDESTGRSSSVALTMGFVARSDGHHVGIDSYETGGPGATSAYDDASDGDLTGGALAAGQADAALADDLDLTSHRSASTSVVIAAGATAAQALDRLDAQRGDVAQAAAGKRQWWRRWLSRAPLPRSAPAPVTRLAKRALISMRQATDPSGLIVASIATQPPHGLDWVRNGAFVNRALTEAHHRALVTAHNIRYAELQATSVDRPTGGEATPPGNWSQNFYADGVVGGPIPYAIDQTGLGIWTLWDHYRFIESESYLLSVYDEIQRAAQYLTDLCRDPATGLHCVAPEGDNANPSQTLRGAQAVWLGLDSAARAARTKARLQSAGRQIALQNAERWSARRDEIGDAIDDFFFDADCRCYSENHEIGGTLLWPVGFLERGTRRSDGQARVNQRALTRAISGNVDRGGREAMALLGNAYAWAGTRRIRAVKRGLRWVAAVQTTDRTGLLGDAWMRFPENGPVTTMSAQPHTWNMAAFYLAALRAYGRVRWTDRT
ncbi:MAG: hypothetical protein ACRDKT_04640 [Actinomycetota bacterium]